MGMKYHTEAGVECTPEECKLIDSFVDLPSVGFLPFWVKTL